LQAHAMSRELRKQHKLPVVQFLAWDPISRMEDELRKISARHELRAKKFEEFSKLAPSPPPLHLRNVVRAELAVRLIHMDTE